VGHCGHHGKVVPRLPEVDEGHDKNDDVRPLPWQEHVELLECRVGLLNHEGDKADEAEQRQLAEHLVQEAAVTLGLLAGGFLQICDAQLQRNRDHDEDGERASGPGQV
jgi:hypothetical protein